MITFLAYYYLIGVAFVAALLISGFAGQVRDFLRDETPPTPPALLPLLCLIMALALVCCLAIMAAFWPWGMFAAFREWRGKQ